MTAPVYACARCGTSPRAGDTFLCVGCLASDERRHEQADAETTYPGDHREQRQLLTRNYGWSGWSRRLGGRNAQSRV